MTPNTEKIRSGFPILQQQVYGKSLVYFDNAATTQKPKEVIEAIVKYYETENANVHRGVHYLSQQATRSFEKVREKTARFVNAGSNCEIIFTRGTTEAINLVASSFGKKFLNKGDEILVSEMEHHSNLVPWQNICEEKQAKLRVIPITDAGELDMQAFEKLLTQKTRLVAIAHVSNTLGTINPVKEIIAKCHLQNIPVLVDGAQAVAHMKVDVQDLDCDFYTLSGHKMYGPMGIGCLYGKEKWLNALPPYQFGGEMIQTVTFDKTTYNELPYKFEAGTPNVADTVGFGAAIDYLTETGLENIGTYENELLRYATEKLLQIIGLKIIGTSNHKAAVISFVMDEIHPYDAGMILDRMGIAVRTGHHCTQPLMDRFEIPGTIRASFSLYNTKEEIDCLVEGVQKVKEMLG